MSDVKIEDLPKSEEISEEEMEGVSGGLLSVPKLNVDLGLASTTLKISGTTSACGCMGMAQDPAGGVISSGSITKVNY